MTKEKWCERKTFWIFFLFILLLFPIGESIFIKFSISSHFKQKIILSRKCPFCIFALAFINPFIRNPLSKTCFRKKQNSIMIRHYLTSIFACLCLKMCIFGRNCCRPKRTFIAKTKKLKKHKKCLNSHRVNQLGCSSYEFHIIFLNKISREIKR